MAISNDDKDSVVGVALKSGKVQWRTALPSGNSECSVNRGTVWCITQPAPSGQDDLVDKDPENVITTINERSGKKLGSAKWPGSGNDGQGASGIVAYDLTGAYFVAYAGDSKSAVLTASKIGKEANVKWRRMLNVVHNSTWDPTLITGELLDHGKLHIVGAESSGKQVVLNSVNGHPSPSGEGHIVDVIDGTVVSQQGGEGLNVGGSDVSQTALATLEARDSSAGQPVLLADATNSSDSDAVKVAASSFSAIASDRSSAPLFRLTQFTPMAYCGKLLYVATAISADDGSEEAANSSRIFEAVDPKSGEVAWQKMVHGYQALWCGKGLVIGGDQSLVGLDQKDGHQKWSVQLPAGYHFGSPSGGQRGPQQGVLAFSSDSDPDQSVLYIE